MYQSLTISWRNFTTELEPILVQKSDALAKNPKNSSLIF